MMSGLKWEPRLVYLDAIVFSGNSEQNFERLSSVFHGIRVAGLSLKPEKCHFGCNELKFLGHFVSHDDIPPDLEKTLAVAAFLPPSNKRDVRRFLGLCAYYRCLVQNFSNIAMPLISLPKDVLLCGAPSKEPLSPIFSSISKLCLYSDFDKDTSTH